MDPGPLVSLSHYGLANLGVWHCPSTLWDCVITLMDPGPVITFCIESRLTPLVFLSLSPHTWGLCDRVITPVASSLRVSLMGVTPVTDGDGRQLLEHVPGLELSCSPAVVCT